MLSTLERHLLLRLTRVFVPVLLGMCALFGLAGSLRLLQTDDLSLSQLLLVLPWILPVLLPYLLPLAYGATVALVLGRMEADQEVLAYVSLGIPRRSLVWPVLLFAVPLTLLTTWLGADVVPHSYQRRKAAGKAVFEHFRDLSQGEHLSYSFPSAGFGLYVRRHDPEVGLEGVIIYSDAPSPPDVNDPVIAVARRGAIRLDEEGGLSLSLEDVTATLQQRDALTGVPIRVHFDHYVQRIDPTQRRWLKPSDYSSADLVTTAAAARARAALGIAHGGVAALGVTGDLFPIEAGIERGTRVALAPAPLVIAWLVAGLTLLMHARSPLVPLVLGLAGTAGLYFLPLLAGRSVGERLELPWLPLAGCAAALATAAVASWAAERPPSGQRPSLGLLWDGLASRAGPLLARLRRAPRPATPDAPDDAPEAPTLAQVAPAAPPRSRGARLGLFSVLDRWAFGQFARAYLAFASAILIVTTIVDFATNIEDFTKNGAFATDMVLARYAALLPELFFVVGPLLGVVAAAWVVGSMRRQNELLALQSVGVGPLRLTAPFLVGGALIAVVVWFDREHVLPRLGEGKEKHERRNKGARFPEPVPDGEGGVLVAGFYMPPIETVGNLRYAWLDERSGERRLIVAPAARADAAHPGLWHLEEGGVELERDPTTGADRIARLAPGATLMSPIRAADVEAAISSLSAFRSSKELRRQLRRTPGFKHLQVQLHEIIAGPLSAVILLLVTVPIALGGHAGGAGRTLACIGVTVGYFVATSICHQLGVRGVLSGEVAAYAPAAMFGAVGVFVSWRG